MKIHSLYITLLLLPIGFVMIACLYLNHQNTVYLTKSLRHHAAHVLQNGKWGEIHQDFTQQKLTSLSGESISYISLQPRSANNIPNRTEQKALYQLANMTKKFTLLTKGDNGKFTYFYGIRANNSCFQCHQEIGLKSGQLRGALAITFDAPDNKNIYVVIFCSAILCCISGFILKRHITLFNNSYEGLQKEARIDALTGLYNKRFFYEFIQYHCANCIRKNEKLAIILCDIDYFKKYNDYYGHPEGDTCLKRVSQVLSKSLTRPLDSVFRYGGEEFIIVLPDTSLHGARKVAEDIRANIITEKIPHEKSTIAHYVTISLGAISCNVKENHNFQEIIIKADQALYQAKHLGRNRVYTEK